MLPTKIFSILILFFSAFSFGLSQNYQPMVLENKYWVMQKYYSLDESNIESGYAIYFQGDTIINDFSYKNVFRTNLSGSHPCPPSEAPCFQFDLPYASMDATLIGHIRESILDLSVHYLALDDDQGCYSDIQETTLFDFSKMVGDTLNDCLVDGLGGMYTDGFGIIESYNNLEVFGKMRNAQRTTGKVTYIGLPFDGDINIFEEVGIEGFGLFHKFNNLDVLYDYCEDAMGDCNLISNTSELRLSSNVRVFPNPVKDQINIEIASILIGSKFSIITVSGKEIRTGMLTSVTTDLSLYDLDTGFYFITIQTDQGRSTTLFSKI